MPDLGRLPIGGRKQLPQLGQRIGRGRIEQAHVRPPPLVAPR